MSAKALDVAAELRNDLSRRFATVSGISIASDGLPWFTVTDGTLAAGQQAALIKVADLAVLGQTIVGLSARNFGHPIQVQVVAEALADAATEIRLAFTALTAPFTVGATVTGGTSAAHAVINKVVMTGATAGYLVLTGVVGTFQAETITDNNGSPGSATASGAQTTANADDTSGNTVLDAAHATKLLGAVMLRGQRVELYLSNNASAPALTDITAAKRVSTFDPDQKYKTLLGA